jgi:hypothetical protein
MLAIDHEGVLMSIATKLAAALVGGFAVVGATWPNAALAGSLPTGKPEDVGMSSERASVPQCRGTSTPAKSRAS